MSRRRRPETPPQSDHGAHSDYSDFPTDRGTDYTDDDDHPLSDDEFQIYLQSRQSRLSQLLIGKPRTWGRYAKTLLLGIVVNSAVRTICFLPDLPFGRQLQDNLGPVISSQIHGFFNIFTELCELALFWRTWYKSERPVDAALLGALLTFINRLPLFGYIHLNFLIDQKTLFEYTLIDAAAHAAAGLTIAHYLPRSPFFKKPPDPVFRRFTYGHLTSLVLAIIIGLLSSALFAYFSFRLLDPILHRGVVDQFVPAFVASVPPTSFAEIADKPLVKVPLLRSGAGPVSMTDALLYALPLPTLAALATLILYVVPRTVSHANIARYVFVLVGGSAIVHLWNIWPLTFTAAMFIGTELGLRTALVSYVMAFVLEDWRGPPEGTKFQTVRLVNQPPVYVTLE